MRRNVKIIQISGLSGILTTLFFMSCLGAGFIAFPAFAAMKLWNLGAAYFEFPFINIYQGFMLWSAIAIFGMIMNNRKKYLSSFNYKTQLSEEEIRNILSRIKKQSQINPVMLKHNKEEEKTEEEKKEKEKENV